MESKIPVPTDNIYKFYALFALLVLIFSMGATLYSNKSVNEVILSGVVEIETLKHETNQSPPQRVRQAALERKMEIAKADKGFFLLALGILMSGALLTMFYGFRKWHLEVQPVADKMAKVQLEIAELQLAKLRAEQKHKDVRTKETA